MHSCRFSAYNLFDKKSIFFGPGQWAWEPGETRLFDFGKKPKSRQTCGREIVVINEKHAGADARLESSQKIISFSALRPGFS
jgi:hypothetical protein